jgi:uncharacterized protein (TIGR02466 family)
MSRQIVDAVMLPMFVTPLLKSRVDDAAALNRALLGEIAARRVAEPGIDASNRGGWHSARDLFTREEPAHREIARLIGSALMAAMAKVAPTADLSAWHLETDGWINVNPPSAFNAPHDHVGWLLSGCYYVALPDAAAGHPLQGAIEFLAGDSGPVSAAPFDTVMTRQHHRLRPRPGDMLIFPASVRHWVYPNEGEEERVTIAFNARARPAGTVTRQGAARPRS